MYLDNIVLCASSAYEHKYYLNDDFNGLPDTIKDELKIMCVLYTEDVGGVLTLKYEEDGNLVLEVSSDEGDLLFDEIGSILKIKELQKTKVAILEALETYYKVFFLEEDANAFLKEKETSLPQVKKGTLNKMIRHIVMFEFAKEAEGRGKLENAALAKIDFLDLLNQIDFIRKMEVGINSIEADGGNYTLCLTCDFDTMEDLQRYATHPEHLKVAAFIGKVKTNRACVDYEI